MTLEQLEKIMKLLCSSDPDLQALGVRLLMNNEGLEALSFLEGMSLSHQSTYYRWKVRNLILDHEKNRKNTPTLKE